METTSCSAGLRLRQAFREDLSALQHRLGNESSNASYTSRPDERPWSERHKAVLWAAMLLAVAVLGSLGSEG